MLIDIQVSHHTKKRKFGEYNSMMVTFSNVKINRAIYKIRENKRALWFECVPQKVYVGKLILNAIVLTSGT